MAQRSRLKRGVEVVRCQGDLSAGEMVKVKSRLSTIMKRQQKKVVLDLSNARNVELAGVGILVDRLRQLRAAKGELKICNLRPEVKKTLNMIGVDGLIESFSSEEEALESFAA